MQSNFHFLIHQSCNAPTRMLVEKSMYNEAIERLKKYTESFEVGDPKKEGEHRETLI